MNKTVRPPFVIRALRIAELVVTVVMLTYCALLLAGFLERDSLLARWGIYLLLMPLMYLLRYLLALIHEAGHMIGGWLTGRRMYSVSVAGWTLLRRGGSLRWGYEATPGVGGLCAMVTDRTPQPFALYLLSGPLATLLLGGACAVLAVRTFPARDLYWDEALRMALAHVPLTMLAVLGVWSGLVNLIPQRHAGGMSDGMQLWLLSRDRACRAAWEQEGRIAWAEHQGQSKADMPEEFFAHPPIARDMPPYAAGLAVQQVSRLLSREDYAAALALCHELLDAQVPFAPLQQLGIVRTGALCEAMLDGPGPLCRRMQDRDMVRLMQFTRRTRGTLLAWYAMAKLISRDELAAGQHRAAYARAAARSPYHESVRADEEFIARVDARAAALAEADA